MSQYDDLTDEQAAFMREYMRRCDGSTVEWSFSRFLGGNSLLLPNKQGIAQWDGPPDSKGFYAGLEQQGYLGVRDGSGQGIVIWPTQKAFEYAKYVSQPAGKRALDTFRHYVFGDRPIWATLILVAASIGGTLLVQWLGGFIGK